MKECGNCIHYEEKPCHWIDRCSWHLMDVQPWDKPEDQCCDNYEE